METIKVNMSPNPLDVQTIHASQNDTEARQWEFELHNNGELIDTSNVTEQLFFKAYKGGTEQILPENTSTPTTSPFKGDIRYPQGLLSDQEFLYRESPTEEDGLAKITDIKGNTLVWNQLVQNGNFADTSLWRTYSSTGFSVSNNVGSFTVTGSTGAIYQTNTPTYVSGHKYLVIADFYVSQQSNISVEVSGTRGRAVSVDANTWYRYSDIVAPSAQGNFSLTCGQASVQVKNVMCFDLTAMGLDSITDPSDFTSLFPLPYYAYNQGTLLSFMGNGIKTVGFNLFDQDSVLTNVGFVKQSDGSYYIQYPSTAQNKVLFENKLKYSGQFFLVYKYKYANTTSQGCRFEIHYTDGSVDQLYATGSNDFVEISFITKANKVLDYISATYGSNIETWWKDVCINISDPSKNGTYEPYTSSTLSLPISTYFSNGMKSAGNVYDELTETKAITRVKQIIFDGSSDENWNVVINTHRAYIAVSDIDTSTPDSSVGNIMSNMYVAGAYGRGAVEDIITTRYGIAQINVFDSVNITSSSTVDTWRAYLQAHPLIINYVLATPTETSFTTASLVTENAEIPLSNDDGVLIGKCTEQLSAEPGFHDAKIKLADEDGECYSNKLQLHVERSPQ